MQPRSPKSLAVIFSAWAAKSFFIASRHMIEAQPSGEITEYIAFSIISTRSAMAMASAPPLPPSPVITVIMGISKRAISRRLRAMASAWPRSSAPSPGYAPGVSTNVNTGRRNFAAICIARNALRYPSGLGMPKLR